MSLIVTFPLDQVKHSLCGESQHLGGLQSDVVNTPRSRLWSRISSTSYVWLLEFAASAALRSDLREPGLARFDACRLDTGTIWSVQGRVNRARETKETDHGSSRRTSSNHAQAAPQQSTLKIWVRSSIGEGDSSGLKRACTGMTLGVMPRGSCQGEKRRYLERQSRHESLPRHQRWNGACTAAR
jgi:hypothetical protein